MITKVQVFLLLEITVVQQSFQALVSDNVQDLIETTTTHEYDFSSFDATEVPLEPELPNPVVHTRVGSFRGLRSQDGNYSMFLGIPYARVDPDNVFGPAIPHTFEGVFDAFDDSSRCPQEEEFNHTITGTLDCLHLHIYVPNGARINNPVPVMVYIFGGKLEFGFAGRYIYGPRFLVRHDVIFISLNYRLGPYGFMCLNDSKVSGNQGLKDQVKALRWIKENIRYFGGDHSKVTVAGNSAGSVAVDLHQYFLQEELYQRVILQDGVALYQETIQHDPDPEAPIKLAKQLNYTTKDINDALSYLNKVDPSQLIAAQKDSGQLFGVCIEKRFDDGDTYITKNPINMKKVREVDVLIGFNSDETCVKFNTMTDEELVRYYNKSKFLEDSFDFGNESELSYELNRIVNQFYHGDEVKRLDYRQPEMNLYSDFYYYDPALRTIRKYLDSGVQNMYFYMFSYSGERSFSKNKDNVPYTECGAAHADELGYLFDISYLKDRLHDEDVLIVDMMTELWTNFVKHGNPTPKPSKLIPLQWPRVTQGKLPYLEINTELRVGSRPMKERMSFLELLYKAIGRYQRGYDAGTVEDNFLL